MGSNQRADRFEQLYKALKKHYKPVTAPSDRKVLDHLMYACCLEDAPYEAADEALAKLQQAYFDSNEIRVTSIAELTESMTSLPHAAEAAQRIKKSLQSMFEARYSFDIDDLKKANLGKAIDEVSNWQGVSRFVVAYVTQHALGGHAIPVSRTILNVCRVLELINDAEVAKGTLPGVERAISKNKGPEFASMLHQFAVDHAHNYKNAHVVAIFKEFGLTSKPKIVPPPPTPEPVQKTAKATVPSAPTKAADPKTKNKESLADLPAAASSKMKSSGKSAGTVPSTKVEKASPSTKKPIPAPEIKTAKPPKTAMPQSKAAKAPGKSAVGKKPMVASKSKKEAALPQKNVKSGKKAAKPTPTKSEPKKIAAKKHSSAAKPPNKKSAASPKSSVKRLPIKPATKKKTKPK